MKIKSPWQSWIKNTKGEKQHRLNHLSYPFNMCSLVTAAKENTHTHTTLFLCHVEASFRARNHVGISEEQ